MKKYLSIIMVLMLVFSLFAFIGCSDDGANDSNESNNSVDDAPSDTTPSDDEPDTDSNNIQAMLDAGEEVIVAWCNNNADEMVMNQVATFEKFYPQIGVTFLFSSSENVDSEQISQIENYVTMGAKQIIFGANDPSIFADIVAEGMQNGVQFIIRGTSEASFTVTALCNTSGRNAGMNLANMALAWLNERYPDAAEGSIGAAQSTNSPNTEDPPRNEALQEYLFSDPRINGDDIYMQDTIYTPDEGYTFAEEALTYNPDIRLFIGYTEGIAMGISNYICGRGDLDPNEYATFGAGYAEAASVMIDQAAEGSNQSCLRGLVTLGDVEEPGLGLYEVSRGLLLGEIEGPNYMGYDIMGVITYLDYEYTDYSE